MGENLTLEEIIKLDKNKWKFDNGIWTNKKGVTLTDLQFSYYICLKETYLSEYKLLKDFNDVLGSEISEERIVNYLNLRYEGRVKNA